MATPTQVVTSFVSMWDKPGGFRDSILAYFTKESVYENIGMSKTTGIDEALAFVDGFESESGGGSLRVDIRAIAGVGDIVLTERTDHLVDAKGKILHSFPVMGAFQVQGDKIIAWRDYFDTRSIPPYDGPGRLTS